MNGYARLVELAHREHELAAGGRVAELPALQEEREALVASLPAQAPEAARPHLERALELTRAAQDLLAAGVEKARADLAALSAHRRVVGAYVGVAPAVTLDAIA